MPTGSKKDARAMGVCRQPTGTPGSENPRQRSVLLDARALIRPLQAPNGVTEVDAQYCSYT